MSKIWKIQSEDQIQLRHWFEANQRPLPWRKNSDPYSIWISESMLQQTTVTAVIPYFKKFLTRFPHVQSLAEAQESEVRELWAGLGYYSRATRLWQAAQELMALKGQFPKSHLQLQNLPGFGPYTSRAVSSLAFNEAVGVLDGNVIRVLSRFHNWPLEWWRPQARIQLQACADEWVQGHPSSIMNQALMELGATLCTPRSPVCALCPLQKNCLSLQSKVIDQRPLTKPKKVSEIWHWTAEVHLQNSYVALVKEHRLPFLKGHFVFPGSAQQLKKKPTQFDFSHSITHHQIFVTVQRTSHQSQPRGKHWVWIEKSQLRSFTPSSLLFKTLTQALTV